METARMKKEGNFKPRDESKDGKTFGKNKEFMETEGGRIWTMPDLPFEPPSWSHNSHVPPPTYSKLGLLSIFQ